MKIYGKEYYKKNKEKINAYGKIYIQCHKDYYSEYQKTYADKRRFGGNRKFVLERDNYKCIYCGEKTNLGIHHLDGQDARYKKTTPNNAAENLITLCNSCHAKTHRILESQHRMS